MRLKMIKPNITKFINEHDELRSYAYTGVVFLAVLILSFGVLKSQGIYNNLPDSLGKDLSLEINNIEARVLRKENLALVHKPISLDEETTQMLTQALLEEYKAEAAYERVVLVFGPIKPFKNIIETENKHSASLEALFSLYNLQYPENIYTKEENIIKFNSLSEACTKGVVAEEENIKMYEEYLSKVIQYTDIRIVFTNNKEASESNHLPAFKKCADAKIKRY
jgi:hypothetical protein